MNDKTNNVTDTRYNLRNRFTLNDDYRIISEYILKGENMDNKNPIRSFRDLEVYQNSYRAMMTVYKEILPALPDIEKYDLKDQLRRSTKSIPRLIAEGYAKRYQKAGFQKYLDDAMGESNETIVGLEQCRDLYNINNNVMEELLDIYDKTGRQLYNLRKSWNEFKNSKK